MDLLISKAVSRFHAGCAQTSTEARSGLLAELLNTAEHHTIVLFLSAIALPLTEGCIHLLSTTTLVLIQNTAQHFINTITCTGYTNESIKKKLPYNSYLSYWGLRF